MENPIKDNRIVNDKTFALRFHSFVEKTQVNDLMSEEEKEYLLYVADKLIKYQAETVSTKAEADYLTNNDVPHNWNEEKIKESDFVAGDIVLWDGEKKVVVPQEKYNTYVYPVYDYTPIGVVVVPASHMDDGKARMMSTRWMSCDDPENGSRIYRSMVWGNNVNVNEFTRFSQVPISNFPYRKSISGVNDYGYLSSNYWQYSGKHNPFDTENDWFYENDNYYIPSPYAEDGTPNPLYRATKCGNKQINNVLSEFNGRQVTDIILDVRGKKDYGIWKPDSNKPEDFPAASCCDMYHTVGTSQGDWYLPSIAELGYVVARLREINSSMIKLSGIQDLPAYWVWSSSEFSESFARYISLDNGLIYYWRFKQSHELSVVAFATV